MNDGNGKGLKDNARLGKIRGELIHVGLRLLAVRALEVGKLDHLKILRGGAAIRAVGALLQLLAGIGERMLAEINDLSRR